MKRAILLLLFWLCSMSGIAQQDGKLDIKNKMGPQAMCDAAAPRLRDTRTNQVVLIMTVDTQGKVQSFTTEAPKGLRLEKMKKAAAEIKAMHFEPAKKDGRPVMVMIRAAFECSVPATDAAK
jgi:hypothetical protein